MLGESRALDDGLAGFACSALGGGLPDEVGAWIDAAGRLRERPDEALALLDRARAAAPGHPAPLVALYRFHFYGHRLEAARAIGEAALATARGALGARLDDTPLDRDAVRYDAAVRFYLFALKGLAYLNLRLGAQEAARALLGELRRLDPDDLVGGALLMHVLSRSERYAHGDGDDAADAADAPDLYAYPARGWTQVQR